MRLSSKEVEMVERLRREGDGVFTVVRQGGEVRQVAKRQKIDVDPRAGVGVSFPTSEGRHAPMTSVVHLNKD